MASIAGIDLLVNDPQYFGGGAFQLSKKASEDLNFTFENGSKGILRKGECYLVVLHSDQTISGFDELLSETHEMAQRTLDILSIMNVENLSVPSGHDEHFLWLKQNGKVTFRHTARVVIGMLVSLEVQITRNDGSIELLDKKYPSSWNAVFRYYRLSQISEDIYDSYRNMYLAFESILSEISPKGPREGERKWIERVLGLLQAQLDLNKFLETVSGNPIEDFINQQYIARRCALFHGKNGQNRSIPGTYLERKNLGTALHNLSNLVKEVCKQYFLLQPINVAANIENILAKMVEPYKTTALIVASEDATPPTGDQTTASPKGLPVYKLDTKYIGILDDLGIEHGFLGSIRAENLKGVSINSLSLYFGLTTLFAVNTLNGPFVLDEIDEFEAVYIITLNDVKQSKRLFPY